METRLDTLELKVMDLEMTLEQLHNVIVDQQQMIDRLTLQIARFEQLIQASESPVADAADEPPPPHY